MWIVVGIVAGVGAIVLIPVLVIGGWFVVINLILGLADGTIWVLDQAWKTIHGRKSRPGVQGVPSQGVGDATRGKPPVPVLATR